MKKPTLIIDVPFFFTLINQPLKLTFLSIFFISIAINSFASKGLENIERVNDCNIVVSEDAGVIIISGLSDNPNLKIFTAGYSSVAYQCDPFSGVPCYGTEEVTGLPDGDYIVRVISEAPSSCDFTQTITIGGGGILQLFLSDFSINEDIGTTNVNVCLNFTTSTEVTCNYFTSTGTAIMGEDFESTFGTLSIPAGELCATISVQIYDDSIDESDETFTFNINSPVGALTSYPVGTITISDNDIPSVSPEITLNFQSLPENANFATLDFCLAAPTGNDVSVSFSTADISAIAGEDFEATSGTVTILAGQYCQSFLVPLINDNIAEATETFGVNLFNPIGATISSSNVVFTIFDDDANLPVVKLFNDVITENPNVITLAFCLDFASGNQVSVDFSTIGISAIAGEDFVATSGTVTIPAGHFCGTYSMFLIDDDVAEPTETFTVNLSNPVGVTIGSTNGAITIWDNDSGVCNVDISTNGTDLTISGLEENDNPNLKIFTEDYTSVAYECNPWNGNPCGETVVIPNLPAGNYIVRIVSDFPSSCNINELIEIGGSTSQCNSPTNLALFKPTNQSTTITANSVEGSANKAVDGNTDGTFFTNPISESSVAATTNENEAWWEVDLGEDFNIESVKAWNRTDGSEKTNNYYILISSTPFPNSLQDARNVASFEFFENNLMQTPSIISTDVAGRYVRVQLSGTGYLTLAEVEIFGCPTSQTLAAPNILNFNAEKVGRQSEASWLMASEKNIDFYELEVSTNATSWNIIDEKESSGIDVARHHSTTDYEPEVGENFYRLRINYKDGSIAYSKTRRLNYDIDFSEVVVYPNPSNDFINLTLRDFSGQSGSIEIFNSIGQQQLQRNYLSFPTIPVKVDVNKFVPGIYMISIKIDNHKRFTKQFVIIDK